MKQTGRFITALVVGGATLLVGLGVYVALGPYRTMRDFGESLAARDSTAIATFIDFPRLQASIKTQLAHDVDQRSKSVFADNPIAKLAASLATSLSDNWVDSLITPAGLEKLLAGERVFSTLSDAASPRTALVQQAIANASYSYRSLSEFAFLLEPKSGVKVEVALERQGLSWKIVGIKLPE
jgi:hypothetical protein